MSGVYGTVRPANVDPLKDVEMYYFYRPSRGTNDDEFGEFKSLDSSCLVKSSCKSENSVVNLMGMYNLRLPLDKFNKKGIYTIYIKPKEYRIKLYDVSVLAAYPDIKGVIINSKDIDNITDLTGYRLEYYNSNGERLETVRLITSCNPSEPILVTATDNYPKTTRYKFTDTSSNYLFCTVTPSSSSTYKPNTNPFIGVPGGEVALSNTKFNPVMLEIEMVEHDAETLTYMLEGDQVRDRDNGVITTYNSNHEIYHQSDYYTKKNSLGEPLYDVKKKRDIIDPSQDYDNIINE